MTRQLVFASSLFIAAAFLPACSTPATPASVTQGPATADVLATVRRDGLVRAGWAPYAPYISKDPATGKVVGYYADLFSRVAEESNLKVEWVETTWGTMIADLKAGRFQVMAAPVFRTPARALDVSFTRSVDYFGYSLVVRKGDTRFTKISDFDRPDVTLAVTQGEVGQDYAKRHLPKAKLNVHSAGDISLALVDVIQQRADAGICDAWTAKQFAKEHADAVADLFADKPFNLVGAGWFVAQTEPAWLGFLNSSIDWLDTTGSIEEVAVHYELGSVRSAHMASTATP